VTPVHFLDYRQSMSSFSSVAALFLYSESGADIGTGDAVRRIRILPVSADYFDVVRVPPTIGRPFGPDEENDAPVVVLSHALWTQQFGGNPSAVGKSLTMNGRSYTVAGVMPDGFADPLAGAVDAWVPGDLRPGRDPNEADNHYLSVIARLRPDVTIARAQASSTNWAQRSRNDIRTHGTRARGSTRSRRTSSATRASPSRSCFGAVAMVLVPHLREPRKPAARAWDRSRS
jgi:hypothetical protein